ncbi:MAG TPA: hypothetical protein VFQ23_13105 [Anaerolineales bacterium]|nr:hypothetical protein [Anaerolineales bacterium]
MNKMNASHTIQALGAGWQSLEKLELPVNSDLETILEIRLMEILASLKLQSDFQNRILRSTLEASRRVVASINQENHNRHIHIHIFIPENTEVNGKTWGFFRIQRLEVQAELSKHTIELYLYKED